MAAGQAGLSLHTMAVLQVYQADLLKELDHGEGIGPDFLRGSQGASLLIPPQGRLTGYPPPTLRQVGPPLVGPCQSAVSGP